MPRPVRETPADKWRNRGAGRRLGRCNPTTRCGPGPAPHQRQRAGPTPRPDSDETADSDGPGTPITSRQPTPTRCGQTWRQPRKRPTAGSRFEHTAARELTAREPVRVLTAREPLGGLTARAPVGPGTDGPCATRVLTARAPLGYRWPVRCSGTDGPCAAGGLTARAPLGY